MTAMRLVAALAITLVLNTANSPGRAEPRVAEPVALALVLLTDVSKSIDEDEFGMIKQGYRAAFSDPEVIEAIAASGGVAISYVEFSGRDEIRLVAGWNVLTDEASTRAFGEAVSLAPRSSAGNTALALSMREAARMLTEGGFGSARLVIDVASDHPWDGGRPVAIRDAAVAAGVTINGLPIIDDRPIGTIDGRLSFTSYQQPGGIVAFFRREVIGGAGSFLVEARSYEAFGEALKRKLLRELLVAAN